MKKSQEAVRSPGFVLEGDGPHAHATRGRDRRQEGGECSYYNLHCNLNKTLLHTLLASSQLILDQIVVIVTTGGTRVDGEG